MRIWGIAIAWLPLLACSFSGGSNPVDGDGGPAVDARLVSCTPDQSICEGTVRRICNASGDGYVAGGDTQCGLTCDSGVCYEATNVPLDEQLACAGTTARLTPPDDATNLELNNNGQQIDCEPHCGDPTVTQLTPTMVDVGTGVELAVFCLAELDIPAGIVFQTNTDTNPALVLFVTGNATVAGEIELDGQGRNNGPGGFQGGNGDNNDGDDGNGGCPGLGGAEGGEGAGGGGAGYGDVGGDGGDNGSGGSGGGPGPVCSDVSISPLIGGSGGGAGGNDDNNLQGGRDGGGGGGALLLAAGGVVDLSGEIRANGADGQNDGLANGAGGGGAGGAILIEAHTVMISGTLEVEGGDGGDAANGADGGDGGSDDTSGGDAGDDQSGNGGGAGGGGGGGRVRINAISAPADCTGASPAETCAIGTPAQTAQ